MIMFLWLTNQLLLIPELNLINKILFWFGKQVDIAAICPLIHFDQVLRLTNGRRN